MTIVCSTHNEYFEAIESLVRRGLTFEAVSSTLTINLTGGY